MNIKILKNTAAAILAPQKGILAADESAPTCAKRFASAGVPCTEETSREYRELLLTTPDIEKYLSGVILFDETIRQKTKDGLPFPEALIKKGIIPGIKVDAGAKELALHPGEKVTEGLDGLRERLAEYKALGARFAKWRAVITIGPNIPSQACISTNAHALARYSALCQEADIVPIVEPEVLIDGDHTIEQSYEASQAILKNLFRELADQNVALEGTILKASMVISGKESKKQASREEVAQATIKCLKENLPKNLAGVVFLSGGQSDEQATEHLNLINKIGKVPWRLTFSYARAIQNPVLKLWAAKKIELAKQVYLFRAKANALASAGIYDPSSEKNRPY